MLLSIGAMAVMGSLPANAAVIYNNFNVGTYLGAGGSIVSGSSVDPYQLHTVANEFVAGATGSVTEIDVAFLNLGDDLTPGIVSLYTVASGALGTSLGSWSGTPAGPFPGCCSITTIPVAGGPTLTAGTSYFLVVAAGGSSALDIWNDNTLGDQNDIQIDFGSGFVDEGVDNLGAFAILGGATAVPEPSTMLLLGSVLAAAFARRRFSH
jgi:hypothetical protein